MRTYIIAGNWKMNKEQDTAYALITTLRDGFNGSDTASAVDIVLCPPFPFLGMAVEELRGSGIGVGAQNLHQEQSGAYTGEVSGPALASIGCTHVIIGHSERRAYFGESDALVNSKLKAALAAGLTAIVCVGETLEEREAGTTLQVVQRQVRGAFEDIPEDAFANIVLAYEPVWAIGTGKTATPEQAQEVHAEIRALVGGLYSQAVADSLRIQYGGSMKPGNAEELLRQPDVDGGLVGGACLDAESFSSIIQTAANLTGERLSQR
jgi:triosephosphate isomerase